MGRGLRDGVGDEFDRRREADAQILADERPETAAVGLEQVRRGGALLLVTEDGVEDRGVLEVAGDADVGDGDETQVGVLDDLAEPRRSRS